MPLNKMVEAATVISSPFGSICHRKEKGPDFLDKFFFSLKKGEWEIHNIIRVGKHETSKFTLHQSDYMLSNFHFIGRC